MPQIDRCGSCAAPIFDVDGVEGACSCDDGIYNTLLARQRYENRRGTTRTASTATDYNLAALAQQGAPPPQALDPFMFLSASARRELEAAQQERNRSFRGSPVHGLDFADPTQGRPHPITDDPTDGFLDLRLEDAPQTDDFEFASPGETFEFGAEIPDGPQPTGGGVNGGRFRIDRPLPPRTPFVAARMPSPQGGVMEEVGRVGRFALLREVEPAPRPPRPSMEEQHREAAETGRARYEQRDRVDAAKLNARQQAQQAAVHEKLPTAYERVASDFLADADDFD